MAEKLVKDRIRSGLVLMLMSIGSIMNSSFRRSG
jgi:hypothetical protein